MDNPNSRAARVAKRAVPVAVNPATPGQRGEQYRPLTDTDYPVICDTALRPLADLGMDEVPKRLWGDLTATGCIDLGGVRLGMRRALVEDIIDQATKTFPLHGRDPNRTIEIGGDRIYFGTGSAAVNTLEVKPNVTARPSRPT